MSKGIRLFHPTARGGTFSFSHNKRPYRYPLMCTPCRTVHQVKTYHVAVDHDGFAIVSPQVWRMMRQHNTAGFSVANEVPTPPAQIVGIAPSHIDVTPLEN